ncbi:hypothetical protein F3K39_19135 [Streptomyces sp. LBUM 1479]|uniref:hypothetical protein n=1 Tax=Streptomyces scabiei TaxID=1930 RepID=UPI001B30FD5D|nr:hypothetical protein [Streptomyces sp. LBUM 1475]MBP5930182.1 hypothetical protein [Streptomyces sp. LBUM 1479]QTU63133.1 hypothetical protein F3K22_20815 [Streptomyces sp. LBUM 1475]
MRTRATVTIAAALLAALTACTSDADSNKPKATAPVNEQKSVAKDDDKAALESSVRSYTKALFSGDGATGYKLLSARCKQEMTAAQFQTMSDQGHNDYGSLEIKTISVDQISGDLARVSYGVGVPQFERKAQPWAREDGVWRWDAC